MASAEGPATPSTGKPSNKKPSRLLFRLFAAICVLAAPAFVAEAYLRMTLHPPAHPGHTFLYPPLARLNVAISDSSIGMGVRTTALTSNALGIRGDELNLEAQQDVFRIVTLGDSVTECMLLDDTEAWPHVLQERLSDQSKRAVWVGNAGRSGEMVPDYIAHTKLLAPQFRPHLLIIMPGGYELQAVVEEKLFPLNLADEEALQRYAEKLYTKVDLEPLRASHLAYVLDNYLHPQALDMTEFYMRMRKRRQAHDKIAELPEVDEGLDVYRSNLRSLMKAAREAPGAPRVLYMTRPFLWKANMNDKELKSLWGGYSCMDCPDPEYYAHESLARSLRLFNEALLAVCEEEQQHCLDLDSQIDKITDNFYDDAHMTVSGSRRTAEAIAAFVVAQGWLQ